jgi:hypothetical protein
MDDRLGDLLSTAFRQVPAREANVAIARVRREQAGGDPDDDDAPTIRAYEMVLSTWAAFVSEQLPKLVYHFESLGAHLPDCKGIVVAAFLGDRLYFAESKAFVSRACALLGVTPEQLVQRYGTGERRTAIESPLLLGPPKN